MKVLLIVGNGFNKLLVDLVRNFPSASIPKGLGANLDAIANNIEGLSSLWDRFNDVFSEMRTVHPDLSDEEIIRLINLSFNCLSNITLFEKLMSKELVIEINKSMSAFLVERIKAIANDFKRYEGLEGYKSLVKLFPYFGNSFKEALHRNKISRMTIGTTNYDGILDTLLTERPKGFIFKDGFTTSDNSSYLELSPKDLSNIPFFMAHIHGSYKFYRKNNITFKLRGNTHNEEPVMVFNNPELKEQMIKSDSVLSRYYNRLREGLKIYDRVIILGNSFKNEPHLKKILQDNFNRINTELVVCSLDPDSVVSQLSSSYNKTIYKFTTANLTSEQQLIDLLSDMLSTDLLVSDRCTNSRQVYRSVA